MLKKRTVEQEFRACDCCGKPVDPQRPSGKCSVCGCDVCRKCATMPDGPLAVFLDIDMDDVCDRCHGVYEGAHKDRMKTLHEQLKLAFDEWERDAKERREEAKCALS